MPHLFGLRFAGGDGRILNQAEFQSAAQSSLCQVAQCISFLLWRGEFDQRVPGVHFGQRSLLVGLVIEDRLQAVLRDDFEPLQLIARLCLKVEEQFSRIQDAGKARPHHGAAPDFGQQAQGGRSHNPQRAFRSDQQLLQIEPAIVLLQRGQRIEDLAIGQHRLQSGDLRAHCPVAQHLRAPGIGRNQPADCG